MRIFPVRPLETRRVVINRHTGAWAGLHPVRAGQIVPVLQFTGGGAAREDQNGKAEKTFFMHERLLFSVVECADFPGQKLSGPDAGPHRFAGGASGAFDGGGHVAAGPVSGAGGQTGGIAHPAPDGAHAPA